MNSRAQRPPLGEVRLTASPRLGHTLLTGPEMESIESRARRSGPVRNDAVRRDIVIVPGDVEPPGHATWEEFRGDQWRRRERALDDLLVLLSRFIVRHRVQKRIELVGAYVVDDGER